jgi:pSer/pThr/pTyr-binding forkhead associated (FHA) protein
MSRFSTDLFRTSCGAASPLELNVSGPGWTGGERRVFEQPFVLIGRHEHTSLRLEDAAVSRRHAYLQQLGGRVFCVDLGSRTGTRWGEESRPAGWLHPDQAIQIGPFTLELLMAAQAGGDPGEEVAEEGDPLQDRVNDPRLMPLITVEGDNKVLAQMRMNRALVLVGSSPACRLRLSEPGISRYHCSLVRTPEGVWVIDLLNETETCLDGQPTRWALVKEGGRLQVGPYVLRFSYPNVGTATPPCRLSETRAETPVPSVEDTSEQSTAEVSNLVPALQAELDQARERLQDAEALRQQLADSQAECVRLQALEASAHEREAVCYERDQWQAEAQALQSRLASEAAERKEWQQRFEAAQQQLDTEREAVRAVGERLDQQSATLQGMRAECAARNAEHSAALQQLQETQDELARIQEEARSLQAELKQDCERLADAEELRQQLEDIQAKHDQLCARIPELEERATSADRLGDRLRAADTATEQLRVQLRAAESQVAELEAVNAECVRLGDQVRALEGQIAEAAETSAHEREVVCAERDQWQAKAQILQSRRASEAAEREEWQQRFEATQQQLDAERESVRAMRERLQHTQDEFARKKNEACSLQAELEQIRECLGDAEALRKQLTDSQAECVRLGDRVRTLEIQVAEAAEVSAHEREAVCAERDQWQAEAQALQAKLASDVAKQEQLDGFAAELRAAHEERDRLHTEQQAALHLAEQAKVRISDLERALTEAAGAHQRAVAETCACWESEKQALQAHLEQERQDRNRTTQAAVRDFQVRAEAAIRDVQVRAAAEREEWRKRLEGAEAQIVCERGLSQEQSEQLRRQVAHLQAERDRLTTRLAQMESSPRAAEEHSRNEAGQAVQPANLRQLAAVDQIFTEFGSIQTRQLLVQAVRTPAPNPPGSVSKQACEIFPQAGEKKPVEHRSASCTPLAVSTDTNEAPLSSEAPQDASMPVEASQLLEELPEPKDETRQGLWRKVLNLVRSK